MTVEATAAPTADAVANGEAIDAHAENEEAPAPAPAPAPEPVAQKKGGRKKKRAGKGAAGHACLSPAPENPLF
eukprot:6195113-Pleurochrysis_carterae.AAC.2